MDVRTHAADPLLPEDLLVGRAMALYADSGAFSQGTVVTSEVRLSVPGAYRDAAHPNRGIGAERVGLARRLFSSAANARYHDLNERRMAIPVYMLSVRDAESQDRYDVLLDARDGTVIYAFFSPAFGGEPPAPPAPIPASLSLGGTSGGIAPLEMTSFTPPGRKVAVSGGGRVFAARFEPGQGALWLRAGGQEPFRAYSPDAALLAALRKLPPVRAFGKLARK